MLKKFSNGHWPIFLLSSISSMGNLFLPVILVRLLDPSDVGIYKIFFLHLLAIPFLVMAGGPIHSVFYWMGISDAEKTKYLNATWVLTLLASSIVLVIGLPFQHQLADMLGLSVEYVQLLLFTGFLVCPSGHFSETTIAAGRAAKGAIFSASFEIFKTVSFILIAIFTRSLYNIFFFYSVLLTLKLIISFYLNNKDNQISFRTNFFYLKKVIKYCLPIAITGCLGFFIDKLDMIILSGHLSATDFAFYSMGCLMIPPLYILEMSVQKVLIPNLSRSFTQQDYGAASSHYRKGIADISYLMIPAIFGLLTFAGPIVSVLYTDTYKDSVIYLQIFAFSYLLLMIPHDSVARATGHTSWILKTYVLLTPFTLGILFYAAKWVSAEQLLVLSLLLKGIPKIIGLSFSRKLLKCSWKEMFPLQKLALYFVMSFALTCLSYGLKPFFNDTISWFLFCSPLFAIIYLGTILGLEKKKAYAFTSVP